jgi:hypothetical protein
MAEQKPPRGRAIDWSDEALDELSVITPADLDYAEARVRAAQPPSIRATDDDGRPYTLRDPAALWDAREDEG